MKRLVKEHSYSGDGFDSFYELQELGFGILVQYNSHVQASVHARSGGRTGEKETANHYYKL